MENRKIIIPNSLRQFQKPWFGKNANPKIADIIRHGNFVCQGVFGPEESKLIHEVHIDPYSGRLSIKESNLETLRAYERMSDPKPAREYSKEEVEQKRGELSSFLSERGVRAIDNTGAITYDKYELILEILKILPDSHFGHEHFRDLKFGSCSDCYAGFSKYGDPEVMIYDIAINGPKRNLVGLLLHEIGHSFQEMLGKEDRKALRSLELELSNTEPFLSLDYLSGPKVRREYCIAEEFIPEMYLTYVSQGAFTEEGLALRKSHDKAGGNPEEPSGFMKFLKSVDAKTREVWREIWGTMNRLFDGTEYV